MTSWNPAHYLQFDSERTRPAYDLLARIQIEHPRFVADLGCGPGNSTRAIRQRWPGTRLTGVDHSPEMISAAQASHPDQDWVLGNVATWTPEEPVDVAFSNACLQWIPDHRRLVRRLMALVASGGALAFQIPSDRYAAVRRHIRDIAGDPAWKERMRGPLRALTMESPEFYYDALADLAHRLDIWETEYSHVMESTEAIVQWISSTGLRPYLEALETEAERARFMDLLRHRVTSDYTPRVDGKVLFPFRRLFVIAYSP